MGLTGETDDEIVRCGWLRAPPQLHVAFAARVERNGEGNGRRGGVGEGIVKADRPEQPRPLWRLGRAKWRRSSRSSALKLSPPPPQTRSA